MSQESQPRAAATVMLLRDSAEGPEVLLLRRHARSGFAADMWVFPGGTVDAADRRLPRERWSGIEPAALQERFAEPPDVVLGLHVAAVRETFEEAGVLLARTSRGTPPALDAEGWSEARLRLVDRAETFDWVAWLEERDLVLALDVIAYHSRWVTPLQEPRRYDTAFFVARAPEGQLAEHDAVEVTEQTWLAPAAALDANLRGELALMYPTVRSLHALARFRSASEAVAAAAAQARVRSLRPHIESGPGGVRVVHPDEADYAELDRRARA